MNDEKKEQGIQQRNDNWGMLYMNRTEKKSVLKKRTICKCSDTDI
jgi:uncharacterized membrane protein